MFKSDPVIGCKKRQIMLNRVGTHIEFLASYVESVNEIG